MSNFYQKNILSYKKAQKRLNDHLSGLEVTDVLHGSSDSRHLAIKIYSITHDNDYFFTISTDNWTWKDTQGKDISVLSNKKIDNSYGLFEITDELKKIIDNKLTIEKVELNEAYQLLKIYFNNNSILEAQKDTESEDQSHYQLSMFGSKIYQNYDLLIIGNDCKEEITNGEEQDPYKIALFDLDYFRMEHRNFTTHAIQQAREKKAPVSFIQARILYNALTTEISPGSDLIFSSWGIRRSSVDRIRLDTIPAKELIKITRDECEKNIFTSEEAKDILKTTIDSLKAWIKSEEDLDQIAREEYTNQGVLLNAVQWYKETF